MFEVPFAFGFVRTQIIGVSLKFDFRWSCRVLVYVNHNKVQRSRTMPGVPRCLVLIQMSFGFYLL